jgi:hypothetical protein
MEPTRSLEEHRQVLAAARDSLTQVAALLHQCAGTELGPLLSEVDALAAQAGGVRCEIVFEASLRGEIREVGRSTREWVYEYAPSQRQGGHVQLAKLVDIASARAFRGLGGCRSDAFVDADAPIAIVWSRVVTGEVAPPLALAVLTEMDRLKGRLVREAIPMVTRAMIDLGVGCGRATMSELRLRLLAMHGSPEEVENEQKRLRTSAFLSAPQVRSGELTIYRMGLTPEQASILEAALGPLAKPKPNPETKERDLRSNGQRRAEALTELCAQFAADDAERQGGPAESDATVIVQVALDTLREHTGAGEVIGSSAYGTLIGAETLRKMCCDASIIPAVLGSDGETLDWGRVERLFTRRQRRAIWSRDRTCTYPGCSAPAAWTRVHHVHHWLDGGLTDMSNAALLCQRHHTYVHDKRLWAEVRREPDESGRYVHWDTRPGSYDIYLSRLPEYSPWEAA